MRGFLRVLASLSISTFAFISVSAAFGADAPKKPAATASVAPAAAAAVAAATAPGVTLKFHSELKDGKKYWLPATATVKAGQNVEFVVTNTLKEPHGFSIDGMVEPQVIAAGATQAFKGVAKAKGDHKITCQLHPAHIGASVKVE